MGLSPLKSCSSSPYAAPNSNPSPSNFKIINSRTFPGLDQDVLVLQVHYPDAKNYEGMKTLVYLGYSSVAELLDQAQNKLDPHFASSGVSPIARFQPTTSGWSNACKFAKMLVSAQI